MALGRRVVTRFELYLKNDPAIDAESDYERYLEELDQKHLKFVDGDEPTKFVIAPLTYRQRMELEQIGDLAPRCEFAIRYGLKEVHSYFIQEEDGTTRELSKVSFDRDARLGQRVAEKWLAEASFPGDIIFSIATAVVFITEAKLPKS